MPWERPHFLQQARGSVVREARANRARQHGPPRDPAMADGHRSRLLKLSKWKLFQKAAIQHSPLAGKVRPFASLNETRPVERMAASRLSHETKLDSTKGSAAAKAVLQPAVIPGHHVACHEVTDRPEAHDQGFGAGQEEGTT